MLSGFLTIAIFNLLGAMSPGPDFALVVRNSILYTKKPAIYTVLGIALGTLFHSSYCILGLALIIYNSIFLFNIVKTIGASYLIYIGIKALFAKSSAANDPQQNHTASLSNFTAIKQGLLCNLLNPKATLFFLGLFTLAITPKISLTIQIIYAVEIFMITFLWFSFLATVITHHKVKAKIQHWQQIIAKLMGGLLIAFGLELAVAIHK